MTIMGKHEIYLWENLVGSFLYTNFWVPNPLPPSEHWVGLIVKGLAVMRTSQFSSGTEGCPDGMAEGYVAEAPGSSKHMGCRLIICGIPRGGRWRPHGVHW